MCLNGDDVNVVFLTASNNLLKFTSIGLTGCVSQGPNVLCGDIESLADAWCSSAGGKITDMLRIDYTSLWRDLAIGF